MGNENTVVDAKVENLNEFTKVLSVKELAQKNLLVIMPSSTTLSLGMFLLIIDLHANRSYM